MKKHPLVSIIIVNWNGGEVFEACLKSLSKLKYPKWELIVVDNGSTDGSEDLPSNFHLPFTNFHLIQNKKNLGFAPANNQGVKKAKGKYVLLLNNDTKVTPDFLNKLVDRLEEDNSIGVIQPKIYMMDHKGYLDNAGSFFTKIGFLSHWGFGEKDGEEFNSEKEVFSCKGACMLIRREVIKEIGLFDNAFVSYFEESDFCWRVWLSGWRVIYYPKAHIYHKVGFTNKRMDVSKINFDYYKNRIASLIKNLSIKNLLVILPLHLVISAGIAFAFLLRRQVKGAFMITKAIFWNIGNIRQVLTKRNQVQKLRMITDKEIFSKLSVPVDFNKFFGDFKRVEKDIK